MSREMQFGVVHLDLTDGTTVAAEDVSRKGYDRFVNALYSSLPDETFVLWANARRRVVRYAAVRDHRFAADGNAA